MPKTISPADLKTLRAYAAYTAIRDGVPQSVVNDKETGNFYVINSGHARRAESLNIVATFDTMGDEKPNNANPVITFDVSAMRSGANEHQFVIWRLEDGEAVTLVGQGSYPGPLTDALAYANKKLQDALTANPDATKVTIQ